MLMVRWLSPWPNFRAPDGPQEASPHRRRQLQRLVLLVAARRHRRDVFHANQAPPPPKADIHLQTDRV
jgi:hypothetical protein